MNIYNAKKLSDAELLSLCERKDIKFDQVFPIVKEVLSSIKTGGDRAAMEFTEKFDGVKLQSLIVTPEEIETACGRITPEVKEAFNKAAANIKKFHTSQITDRKTVETMPGVICFSEMRPIDKVGLYVPGGTAPLPSTVLMLAIPAKLAGCKDVVLATPPSKDGTIADIILFAANLCGVDSIYKVGGAQAIASMAYGSESIKKADKIFGPGNQYVTAAKMLVSIDPDGAAIDMPAGPTEVLVIADGNSRADFVASDLLSQAEHGVDSQAILVCTDLAKTASILDEVKNQLKTLPRKAIAEKALSNSFALVVDSVDEAIEFSNMFAPEHLLINTDQAEELVDKITNAGSVFLGPYSSESAGDYASGTNHSLPTYGYVRAYGGVSVTSFQKQMTFQKVTAEGAKNIGPIVATLAAQESLEGHKRAMEFRL